MRPSIISDFGKFVIYVSWSTATSPQIPVSEVSDPSRMRKVVECVNKIETSCSVLNRATLVDKRRVASQCVHSSIRTCV